MLRSLACATVGSALGGSLGSEPESMSREKPEGAVATRGTPLPLLKSEPAPAAPVVAEAAVAVLLF